MQSLLQRFTSLFPLWVVGAGVLGVSYPPALLWVNEGSWITVLLGVIMLGMGLTLEWKDFERVFRFPGRVFLGVALQYSVMPLLGYGLARLYDLPPELAAGLILVACCPGGTASNVISFLARANVGLSVTMTAVSTVLAVLMTPVLTLYLVGNRLEVDGWALFRDTVTVVLLPVALGVLLNRYLGGLTRRVQAYAPPIAVIAIALIVGAILGRWRSNLLEAGLSLLLAVVSLHLLGFSLGYILGRLSKNETVARTIAIEVGMQNSGLAVKLADGNFPGTQASVPGALSAMVHSILGSLLAAIWSRYPHHEAEDNTAIEASRPAV